ncbi:MAG: AraC family transcriptional regulator [Oscillospiraceae bacterium]|jgi:AraC family transcriptional regulator|nr:AraC family transcriptional regulator [Oscillospiraceae bacterium]
MSYRAILQDTLEYIDAHLRGPICAEQLAARAGFSPYHFSRVFLFNVGCTVMVYVRLRRLAYAAAELSEGRKILDIALDYGFETHSGFSKAFRRRYGCSPERFRLRAKVKRPELPSLSHMQKYNIPGGIVMEPRFVTRDAFTIAGYSINTTSEGGVNSTEIPAFWQRYVQGGQCEKLHGEMFLKSHAEYGACFPMDADGSFTYAIGCEPREGRTVPEGYELHTVPAADYAVFTTPPSDEASFTANIQGTWRYIFNEWFPKSGYEYGEGLTDFEYYDTRSMGETGKTCDIYIPVKPAIHIH